MSRFLAIPVALPLLGAALCAVLGRRDMKRAVAFGIFVVLLIQAGLLVGMAADGDVLATAVGGWPPAFAISLVVDLFSAMMLFVAALMIVVCCLFAVAREEDDHPFFYTLVLILSAGICGSFMTADLFNLFVFFEVMLIASYVLLTIKGGRRQIRSGAVYVTTSLMASTVLIAGTALLYGSTGTVNLAALSGVDRSLGMTVAGCLLLVAFAVKASLVPVHGWLPTSYPSAPPAVAALFSGLLTKVGIYAMFRVFAVVFGGRGDLRGVLLVIASATMLIGVLGALGRSGMREILSFHIVSQVGYMLMGLGLFTALGLAGGIFYILHHIVVKTSLFLTAGAIETVEGTGLLDRLESMARKWPAAAVAFVLSAFSLAGLPPFSGFFAKLMLVRAAFDQASYGVAGVAILAGLLTLMSMLKIWDGVFAGGAEGGGSSSHRQRRADPRSARRAGFIAPAVFLTAVSLAIAVSAPLMIDLSNTAARALLEPATYVTEVLKT